jgi:nucleotide-binding universal stress UspA family protein
MVKVAHRVSQGIVDTAEEEACNFIILGRQKDPDFLERFFSSVIDSVIQESPCEVAVLHGRLPSRRVKDILIPFAHDIHTRLAVEITPALAEFFRCKVRIGVVDEPESRPESLEERMAKIRKLLAANSLQASISVVRNRGILQGLLQLSRTADLMVMAGRTGDFLELLLRRSLAQEITEEVSCPVLWVKEFEERPPLWTSLFRRTSKEVTANHG